MNKTRQKADVSNLASKEQIVINHDKTVLTHHDLHSVETLLRKWIDKHSFDNIIVKPNWVSLDPLTRTEIDMFSLTINICIEHVNSITVADCPIDKTNFSQL